MKKKQINFLKELVETPSPTGFETDVADIVRTRLSSVADEIQTDTMGSVHAILKGGAELEEEVARAALYSQMGTPEEIGQDYEYISAYGSTYGSASVYEDNSNAMGYAVPATMSVMLAAHMDEVGLMVTYISDDGYLSVSSIGGVDAAILPGTRVDVHTEEGVLRGVVARKPIHLIDVDERKTVTPLDKLAIDLGMDAESVKKRVRVGDPITYGVGFERLGDTMAVSKSFDDKCGVFVACRVMERIAQAGRAQATFISAITVQEEIGTRGAITSAHSLNPDVAIAFDVTHATDYPGIDKTKYGSIVCGDGPVIARGPNINPFVFERLIAAAEAEGVHYQLEAEPGITGTDARSIQIAQGGIPTGLISIPLRYMHTPAEVIDLNDLEGAIRIISRFVQDLDVSATFIPGISEAVAHPDVDNLKKSEKTDKQKISELKKRVRELSGRLAKLEEEGITVEKAEVQEALAAQTPSDDVAQNADISSSMPEETIQTDTMVAGEMPGRPVYQSAAYTGAQNVAEGVDISKEPTQKMEGPYTKGDFSAYTPSFGEIVTDDVIQRNAPQNQVGGVIEAQGEGAMVNPAGVQDAPEGYEFKRSAFPVSTPLSSAIPSGSSAFSTFDTSRIDYSGFNPEALEADMPSDRSSATFNLPIIGPASDDQEE